MKTTKVELTVEQLRCILRDDVTKDLKETFQQHLDKLAPDPETNYRKYLNTYAGKRLLENHSLEEYGTWEIRGEDPNCDFGGHHHQPHLGTVEGTLEEVIKYGANLGNFWQWGGGGDFRKVNIKRL